MVQYSTPELRGLETRTEPSEIATELVMEGRKPGGRVELAAPDR